MANLKRRRHGRHKYGIFYLLPSLPQHKLTNDDEYMMMTIRSHDQFNTTIYGFEDRYQGYT